MNLLKRARGRRGAIAVTVLAITLGAGVVAAHGSTAKKSGAPWKIDLSLSYTGNNWQSEAADLMKAEALTPPYNKLVTVKQDIAGTVVTNQIRTLQNEIASGANAIIVYPLSPTALNGVIAQACAKHIVVFAYDSLVTAPCAYNVHPDQFEIGRQNAEWLAKQLHGKGSIVAIKGVPGTTSDTDHFKGLTVTLKKYPGLKLVATAPSDWSGPGAKKAMVQILASHPHIDGVWAEAGGYAIEDYLISQGYKHGLPVASEASNMNRIQMLPKSRGGLGLHENSPGSQAWSAELALREAVEVLQGKSVPHDTILAPQSVNNSNLRYGTNPAKGVNVYPKKMVPPGFFADIWSPVVQQGLKAALTGKPDKISNGSPKCVPGVCRYQAKLTFDPNHSGGN